MPEPQPLVPGIYPLVETIEDRRLTVVLVTGERGATLVDTGVAETPARLIFPALRALELEPSDLRFVVVTHSDIDHSGGVGAILAAAPAVTVIAHRLDVPWIEDVERLIEERYRRLRDRHGIDPDPTFFEWVRASDSGGIVDVAVSGGETLRLGGGRELELVHVPGHSRGHLALVERQSGSGLIGDAVFGAVTPALDGAGSVPPGYYDVGAYRASVARLRELELERLVGAHYPVIEGPTAVNTFLDASSAFCDRLEEELLRVLGASDEPMSTRALIEAVAPGLRAWPEAADLGLSAAVMGHLEDLRERGLVESLAGEVVCWQRH